MIDWIVSPAGFVVIIGLLLLATTVGAWLIRRRRHPDAADEVATEIVADAGPEEATAYLVALESSLRLPQKVPLHANRETRLGRDRHTNTVALNDISISRHHATIISRGKDYFLRDEESRGGTFVNRRRLHKDQKILLHHDDVVQFYTFTYRFVLSDAPTQSGESEVTESSRLDIDQLL